MKLEHVGIAVSHLGMSNELFAKLLGKENYKTGVHHLAFKVEDIHVEMKRLDDLGFKLLNTEPKLGADNKLICFLHPKSTNGVLIELCQDIDN